MNKVGFDPATPSIARVYDYWLGGRTNFAADRVLARHLLEIYPGVAQMVRDNRKFIGAAVSWAAEQGIAQFIDLGAGLPTRPSLHETARAKVSRARVAYVDNDPVVVSHASALLAAGREGLIAAEADLRDPEEVLADPGVAATVNLEQPACLVFGMVLHFLSADAAQYLVRRYVRRLVPGSCVVISVAHGDGDIADRFVGQYAAAPLRNHSVPEFTAMFDGLSLVPPGVSEATAWDPAQPARPIPQRGGLILAAVGQVA